MSDLDGTRLNVVLDASVLCRDYFFRSPDARVLLDALGRQVECIYIPEVARLEAINKNREDLDATEDIHRKYVGTLDRLSRLTQRPEAPDVRALSHTYFTFIQDFLRQPRVICSRPSKSEEI
jgi:hypothetical protein